ncbi:hypothetical protein ACN28S_67075 [Cystobacter fuscus]
MTDLPPKPSRDELTERAARVRLLVFDVDGSSRTAACITAMAAR